MTQDMVVIAVVEDGGDSDGDGDGSGRGEDVNVGIHDRNYVSEKWWWKWWWK